MASLYYCVGVSGFQSVRILKAVSSSSFRIEGLEIGERGMLSHVMVWHDMVHTYLC